MIYFIISLAILALFGILFWPKVQLLFTYLHFIKHRSSACCQTCNNYTVYEAYVKCKAGGSYRYSFHRGWSNLTWFLYRRLDYTLQLRWNYEQLKNYFKYKKDTYHDIHNYELYFCGFSVEPGFCEWKAQVIENSGNGYIRCNCTDGLIRSIPSPCIVGFSRFHHLEKKT